VQPYDRIAQASWTLVTFMKFSVMSRVYCAFYDGTLDIDNEALLKLMQVIGPSVEEGYHKGYTAFMQVVEELTSVVDVPLKMQKIVKRAP
jgi:hypothetical protein